jgi:hypothetical protein
MPGFLFFLETETVKPGLTLSPAATSVKGKGRESRERRKD